MALHAAGALVVLVAIVAMLHGPTPAISDDGSVLAQAQLLHDGRTGTDLPIPSADPAGAFPPLENSSVVNGRAYPYVKHLALPAAVAGTESVFGDVGGVLFSAVSVWFAALAAAALAWRVDRRLAAPALWATALLSPLLIMGGTALAAWAIVQGPGLPWLNNPGFHGFSEMLYEFTSANANNGSGFEGLGDNNPFWNISTGIVLILGRFVPIIGPVAIAGLLASKKYIPESTGTLKTDTATFGIMVFSVIVIITALSYFPALALGPLAEYFSL